MPVFVSMQRRVHLLQRAPRRCAGRNSSALEPSLEPKRTESVCVDNSALTCCRTAQLEGQDGTHFAGAKSAEKSIKLILKPVWRIFVALINFRLGVCRTDLRPWEGFPCVTLGPVLRSAD